jgi:hypothetical protein
LELYRERSPLYTRHADLIFREDNLEGDRSIPEHTDLLITLLNQEYPTEIQPLLPI